MLRQTVEVAFIILNWNKPEMTSCRIEDLLTIELSELPGGIVVVDNGSSPQNRGRLIEYVLEKGGIIVEEGVLSQGIEKLDLSEKRIFLILNDENYGYAKGNNVGLKFAKKLGFKYAVIMNNDVLLNRPVTSTLISILNKVDKAAVIGPRVIGLDGKDQGPFWKDGIFDYFFLPVFYPLLYPLGKVKRLLFERYVLRSCKRKGYAEVYRVMGCFMLVDLDRMEEVGWFDEGTFLYGEEAILSEKLLARGYKTLYTNATSVLHEHEVTIRSSFGDNRWKIRLASELYYLERYRRYGSFRLFLVKAGRFVDVKFQTRLIRMVRKFLQSIFKRRDSSCAKVSS